MKFKTQEKVTTGCGCFSYILLILFNVVVGGWSVVEILSWMGKTIPIWADGLIGLVVGELSVPVAIVGWILKICGVF